jgi:hypothetical protein
LAPAKESKSTQQAASDQDVSPEGQSQRRHLEAGGQVADEDG